MKPVIALLRGINVGGNRMVSMTELRGMLEASGNTGAQTLLQSGNVVFPCSKEPSGDLEAELEALFAAHFGFRTDVICRSLEEWDKVIARCPMPELASANPSRFHVHFLKHPASREQLQEWEAGVLGPETIRGFEKELYINYPEGMGQSKLKVPFVTTSRNWNTVLKLADLARR